MQKNFSGNVCLRTKFDLRLKKKQKNFWCKFSKLLEKFLCRHQKMPVIQFPYMENVWKAFVQNCAPIQCTIWPRNDFYKKKYFKSVFFCHQPVQLFSKSRRNGLIFWVLFTKGPKIIISTSLELKLMWLNLIG